MASNLIASLKSPSGRHAAKVYHSTTKQEFRSAFYVDGVRHDYADAFTYSWAEAMEETLRSLNLADEMCAALLARAATAPAQP